jgi:hypothetical protein
MDALFDFTDKVVMITGGSRGLGFAKFFVGNLGTFPQDAGSSRLWEGHTERPHKTRHRRFQPSARPGLRQARSHVCSRSVGGTGADTGNGAHGTSRTQWQVAGRHRRWPILSDRHDART